MKQTLLALLLVLLCTQTALAFSVSPAKHETTAQGTQEFMFQLREANEDIELRFEGELAPYATGNINGNVASVQVNPPELESGPHELLVVFRAQPQGGQLSALAELAPKIIYNIPYQDAFIIGTLGIQEGKPVQATLMLRNRGVNAATVTPEIHFETTRQENPVTIQPGEVQRVPLELTAAQPGDYELTITLITTSEVEKRTITEQVRYGQPAITINEITAEGDPGTIVPIELLIESAWNKPLDTTINAIVTAQDVQWVLQEREVILEGTQAVELFWEATGASHGNYTLELMITENGEQTSTTHTFIFKEPGIISVFPWWLWLLILLLLVFGAHLLFKNK